MISEPGRRDVGVAIPAAGSGRRMGGRRKPLVPLLGEPLLLHALRPFLDHPEVGPIVIALSSEDAREPPEWLSGLGPRVRVVEGGVSRLDSVYAALSTLGEESDVIVVHDGARPLVTRDIIDRCIAVAREGHGAVAGWPAVDTLKETDGEGWVVATPDRERFWHAQTPQGFPRSALVRAYRRALQEGATATDDAALFQWDGGRVRMVEGAPWNLKVTRPVDLALAEQWLGASRGTRAGAGG